MKRSWFWPIVAAVVPFALAVGACPARADFAVQVTVGVTTVTITDNETSPQLDSDPTVNSINWNGTVGGVHITVLASTTSTPIGNPPVGSALDLTYSATNVTGAVNPTSQTVMLLASANGFTQPPTEPNVTITSSGGGTNVSSSTTYQQWLVNSPDGHTEPTLFTVTGTTPGPQGPSSDASFHFNNSANGSIVTPFELTERVTAVLSTNGSQATGDLQSVLSVPAPAGLMLLASGLPFLGIGEWLRRRIKGK